MTKELVRGSTLNFAGTMLGMLVSFFGYPYLVRGLGAERFGVTSIAGAVVAYFMVFDLGLSRASVVFLGKALESKDGKRISGLFWSGQALMGGLGSVGALALLLTTPYLCRHVLLIPPHLQTESVWGLGMISLSVPVMIVFSAHLGFLGNTNRFATLNLLRTAMSVLTWLVPLAVLPFRHDIPSVFGAMLATRVVISVASLAACLRAEPVLLRIQFASWHEVRPFLGQGGWMSITNLVSPLMSYLDRAMVGALASLTAVTYYSVAGDTSQKLWIVQSSITGALFPLLPGMLVADRSKALEACRSASRLIFLSIVPATLLASAFGRQFLHLWIGPSIAEGAACPFAILLLGVFINTFAYVPFSFLMAENRSRFAALTHLVELPFFLAALYLLVPHWGATGAAIAWTLRVGFDAGAMLFGGWEPFRERSDGTRKEFVWIGATIVVLAGLCMTESELLTSIVSLTLLLAWSLVYRKDLAQMRSNTWARLARILRLEPSIPNTNLF